MQANRLVDHVGVVECPARRAANQSGIGQGNWPHRMPGWEAVGQMNGQR
jgi:hypothetical protein